MSPKLKTVLSGLVLILATVAFFYRFTLSREILIARDILRIYYPIRAFWADQVAHGQFPGWYPYDSLGLPFAGSLVTGTFHPINLIYLVLPLTTSAKLNAIICYPIAFLGTYLFLKAHARTATASAVGATLFSFSGYLVSMTNNLLYLMSASFIPWVLVAVQRICENKGWRYPSLLALCLSSMLLAGDPQCFVLSAATAISYAAFCAPPTRRLRPITLTLLGLGLAALVCTVQIVSSLPVIQEGSPALRTLQEAEIWSLSPLRIIDIALGNFSNVPEKFIWSVSLTLFNTGILGFWADSLYIGISTLPLALLGIFHRSRKRVVTFAIVFGALLFALTLGKYTPIYGFLYRYLPGWQLFRYPEKIFPHFLICLCVIVSRGFDLLINLPPKRKRIVGTSLLLAGLALLVLRAQPVLRSGLVLLKSQYQGDLNLWAPIASALEGQLLQITLHAAAILALFGIVLLARRLNRALQLVLYGLIAADIASVSLPVYRTSEPEMISILPGFAEIMRQNQDRSPVHQRMFSASETFYHAVISLDMSQIVSATFINAMVPDTNGLWQIENAAPYLPGTSARVARLESDRGLWWGRFMSMANVSHITVNAIDYEQMHGRPDRRIAINHAFQLLLLSNPNELPRVHLARPLCVRTPTDSFQAIAAGSFIPGKEAILECPNERGSENTSAQPINPGSATVTEYSPMKVAIDVQANEKAALVLADAYYSGWSATVDGLPVPIFPANHAFRGVLVNPGHHTVRFTYQVPHLILGAWISGLALMLALIPWLSLLVKSVRYSFKSDSNGRAAPSANVPRARWGE